MYDCLIIGGGVVGLSIAFELAGHGLRLRVIDRGKPAREASWAGAGILPPANPETAIHPLDKLRALSHRLHPEWAATLHDECGIDNGYRRCGGMYLARSIGEAASLHGMKRFLDEQRIACHRLSLPVVVEKEPALSRLVSTERLKAAYELPDEAQLRNPRHLQALIASCLARGVEISSGVELLHLDGSKNCVHTAVTTDGQLKADRFCICGGAWTQGLLQQLGHPNGIMPVRGQMLLFKCKRPPFRSVINEGPRYLVPRDDGRVLVGSTEEEVGFNKSTTEMALRDLMTLAGEIIPQLRESDVEKSWAGLRPGSYDGFPYLGIVPALENVFVAAGHFRSGLQLSTGTAVVMSQLIRGEQPQIDLAPFRVGRG